MKIFIFVIIIFALMALAAGIFLERQTLFGPSPKETSFPETKTSPQERQAEKPTSGVAPAPTSPKAEGPKPGAGIDSCANLKGFVCAETSEETCVAGWIKASDSSRCCVSKCVSQPVYTKSAETGKVNIRNCYPNGNKNKVTVIIKEGGIYDNPSLALAVSDYLDIVRKNLGVENAGLKKFRGASMAEFNNFVDNLYLKENAVYMILAGDDLPNAEVTETSQKNQNAVLSGLAFVNRDFKPGACIDIAFSQIVPRLLDLEKEKVNFVVARFRRYAEYQQNPPLYLNQYQKEVLRIKHDPEAREIGAPVTFYPLGYEIITKEVFNSNHEAVRNALNEKPLIARFDVHGLENLVGIGINNQNLPANSYYAYYTTLREYSDFVKSNGLPSLFVDAGACQATTIKYRDEKFCCWPQTFLESGAWAYYSISPGTEDSAETKAMLEEKFIGKAIIKTSPPSYFIFGDILGRLKI